MNFNKLPKIELHCHLDGCLRAKTVVDIIKEDKLEHLYNKIDTINNHLFVSKNCESLDEYLEKFQIPNEVMQTTKNLKRISFELVEDAAKSNVKYIEIRFAPLLHTSKGLTFEEIVESVLSGMKEAEGKYDIETNLILCCMRISSEEKAIEVIEKGKKYLNKGVVAVDLCASENENFPEKFERAINLAKNYGYRITIHAGETGIGENVLKSIKLLHAERIGHGVYIKDCDEAYNLVKKLNIPLEMCPTSNIDTKAVIDYASHPFKKFLDDGIKVTMNTDNMTVSNTDLNKEYNIMNEVQGLTLEDFKKIYENSIEASFASPKVKEHLKKYLKDFK
ncbi:adenosine deaminase [Clostridium oceanicum]|uniref:Adenosine deaminase n=1 Tax=Clostridium oceanicum TaxID=1543 RepID=A0ABP3UMX0_9CLOT